MDPFLRWGHQGNSDVRAGAAERLAGAGERNSHCEEARVSSVDPEAHTHTSTYTAHACLHAHVHNTQLMMKVDLWGGMEFPSGTGVVNTWAL